MQMKHIAQDFRYALRSIRKRPGFAAVTIAALALCIGANTAIFSIVDSALLHSLPFPDPGRLVGVFEKLSAVMTGPIPFSAPDYEELLQRSHSFQQAGIYQNEHYELSGVTQPERLQGARISASLFPTLGISPALGRNFTKEEDVDRHRVAILSGQLWRSKFGGDPAVIGKAILLDRVPYTVVGVMPDRISFPLRGPAFNDEPAQVYVPISFTKAELEGWGNMYNNSVVARLHPGATLEQARAEVKSIVEQVYREVYPANLRTDNFGLSADVMSFRDEVVGKVEPMLLVLFGAVGLVLLIGCADIASLLLTHAAGRQREMSIRTALGASRSGLIRQVLIESLVLAAIGGGAGLLLSFWATTVLVNIATVNLPLANTSYSSLGVIAFTAVLSAITALLFGMFPALQASRVEVNEGLREGGRGQTAGRRRGRTLNALVIAQFALALVLLVGAGLLARSFSRLLATNPGFRPDHILTMTTSLPPTAYKSGADVRGFYERLQNSLESTPGVKDAAIATSLPLAIGEHREFAIDGQLPQTLNIPRSVAQIWTLGHFFQAMGISLKRGRYFDWRDSRSSMPVAIVSETLAKKFWPGQDPIGKRIKWGDNASKDPWMTIVGVVGDVKQGALDQLTEFETYTPYEQVADSDLAEAIDKEFRSLKVVVLTAVLPERMAPVIEREIHSLDPSLPVTEVSTMDAQLRSSTRSERFNTILLGTFASAALILAALGIAGVLAYSVAQRMSEIGVRVAMGATKADIAKLVLTRGMSMALAGIGIGILCSLAITRVMRSLLYRVSPWDPWTLIGAVLLLSLVGLLSVWVPARRAAAVDPIRALRVE